MVGLYHRADHVDGNDDPGHRRPLREQPDHPKPEECYACESEADHQVGRDPVLIFHHWPITRPLVSSMIEEWTFVGLC